MIKWLRRQAANECPPPPSPLHIPNRLELSFRRVLALPKASNTVLLLSRASSILLAMPVSVSFVSGEGEGGGGGRGHTHALLALVV